MLKVHNLSTAKENSEKLECLYEKFENVAPKYKVFAEINGLRREFAIVATSAWLRIIRLASKNGDHKLTKHLLPRDENAAQILASLVHFKMTEKKVINLFLKFKRKLFENKLEVNLPFNLLIIKKGNEYFLEKPKPE